MLKPLFGHKKKRLDKLWKTAGEAFKDCEYGRTLRILRIVAKFDKPGVADYIAHVKAAIRTRRLRGEELDLEFMDPAKLDNIVPCPSDVWAMKEYDDPLNNINEWLSEQEELFLDEWSREITEGTEVLLGDGISHNLERRWLAKGWPETGAWRS